MATISDDSASYPAPKAAASTSRRFGAGMVIMASGILGSRVLGLVREGVTAHQFGQSRPTDAYTAAFILPDLLFFLIAGGALSGAFIPVFSEYITTKRETEAWRIFSAVATIMAVVVLAFIVFSETFTVPLVLLVNPGYAGVPHKLHGIAAYWWILQSGLQMMAGTLPTPEKAATTVMLTRILLPAQICFFLGGLMMGTLQVKGNSWGQALGPMIYNLGIILGGLFLTQRLGIAGLCWGAVGGAIVGNLILQWVLVLRMGGRFVTKDLRTHLRHPGVRQVGRLMLPVILGLALPQVSTIIGRSFASELGDGSQSALKNANILMQIPLGVFAQAASIAIFPIMSAQAALKQTAALRDSLNFALRTILFLTIPSSMLMWVLALPFSQVVFQSGQFGLADAQLCAAILRWFAVGIFAWSAHSILSRGFYALQDSKTPIIVGTVVTLIFIPMNAPLMARMGVSGLALATTIAATIHMTGLLVLLRRRLHGLDGPRLLLSVTRTVGASILASLVCALLYHPLAHRLLDNAAHGARGRAALVLLLCLTVSSLVYLGAALCLQMEEVSIVRRPLRKLVARFSH